MKNRKQLLADFYLDLLAIPMSKFRIENQSLYANALDDAIRSSLQPASSTIGKPPLRQCGYCQTWNSKPCGEQCHWSPSDPVFVAPASDAVAGDAKALAVWLPCRLGRQPSTGKDRAMSNLFVPWTRWFAWYPVELQNGKWHWLRCVEYEQYRTHPIAGAFAGGSRTITHYRLPDDAPEFRMMK